MHSFAKWLAAPAAALLLTGCFTVTAIQIPVEVRSDAPFVLADGRPAEDRASRKRPNADGSVSYLGDDSIQPSPLALVRTALQQRYGGEHLRGKTVTLKRFMVEIADGPAIDQTAWRKDYAARMGLPPGQALVGQLLGPAMDKMQGSKRLKVQVDLLVDGQAYSATSEQTSTVGFSEYIITQHVQAALRSVAMDTLPPFELPVKP